MNRVVALGIVGWIAFAVLGGCQGADPFDRSGGGGKTGGGGQIVTGNGGHIVTGNGGSGAGGRASGGIGAGGSSMGGRGMGGAGGSAVGGAGGLGAGGSNMGGRGMGGTGAGGRIVVDGGANCISAIQMSGYSSGTATCAGCLDHSTSIGPQCMMMIDCLGQNYPCTGNCYTTCFNKVGGSNPLVDCMTSLNISSSGCGP